MSNKQEKQFQETLKEISDKSEALQYEEALYRILDAGRLDVAKEIAADVLGEDLEEYLEQSDLDERTEIGDDYFDQDERFFANDEEYPF